MNPAFISCRVLLVATLAVAFWMNDCGAPLGIEAAPPAERAAALRGFGKAPMALLLCRTPDDLDLFHLNPGDCQEVIRSMQRDFVFIGTYTLAYLSLAWLLWQRGGTARRVLAISAVLLALLLAACDVAENRNAIALMQWELPIVGVAPSMSWPDLTPTLVAATRATSLGKWASDFALAAIFSAIFWERRWSWPALAALLMLLTGLVGESGVLLECSGWLPPFAACGIGLGATLQGIALLIGTCLFLAHQRFVASFQRKAA